MKQNFDYSEFIEKYLQGEMSPKERIWFEKEVEGNQTLVKEINIRKQIDLVLADKEAMDLKIQLEQIHKEIYERTEKEGKAVRFLFRRVYASVATLLLFSISFTYFLMNRDYSNAKLIETYYEPVHASVNYRSVDDANNTNLREALALYNGKEYRKASILFEEILGKDENKLGVNLYSGISHMEIHEYSKANERFMNIIDRQPNPFVESANWYLGLCYIMTNERDKAYRIFEDLASKEGYYQKDARKILRRLE